MAPAIRRRAQKRKERSPPSSGDEAPPAQPSDPLPDKITIQGTNGKISVIELTAEQRNHLERLSIKQRPSYLKRLQFEIDWETKSKSNEQVLKEQMEGWSSVVYDHFKLPKILEEDGEVKYSFVCKKHPSSTPILRTRHDTSTSNLKRHYDVCEGKLASSESSIATFAHGSTYSHGRLRFKLALWLARNHRPYLILKDPDFCDIIKMLYAQAELPSPKTASRDILEMFTLSQPALCKYFKAHKGRFHIAIDGWTAPNVVSFLGVVISFIENGEMMAFILDYLVLKHAHQGVYLASRVRQCLTEYGIEKQILGVVGDNASNNDVLAAELESLGGINSARTRIRCIAHIFNLVTKALITPFCKVLKSATPTTNTDNLALEIEAESNDVEDDDTNEDSSSSDPEEVEAVDDDTADSQAANNPVSAPDNTGGDGYELESDREENDLEILEEVIKGLEAGYDLLGEDEQYARCCVSKLVALAKRIFHSPTIREDFKTSCELNSIKPRLLKRAVDTRWNSLADCIERALQLRPAIQHLLALTKYNNTRPEGLRKYVLATDEWKILEELYQILKIFTNATKLVSQSKIPLLHQVIPIIDIIEEKLVSFIKKEDLHSVVRIAAVRGRAMLNKYYAKTDEGIMIRISMIFVPEWKLEYFREHDWHEDWISDARDIIREQWTKYYKPAVAVTEPASNTTSTEDDDPFATLRTFKRRSSGDALEEYLNAPLVHSTLDPIQYWMNEAKGGNTALAQMALDFLSAPATSVDVERGFSRGGLMVSKRRHALSDKSIRAGTVLSSWAEVPGLIPEATIIKAFQEKSKRGRKKGLTAEGTSDTIVVDSE